MNDELAMMKLDCTEILNLDHGAINDSFTTVRNERQRVRKPSSQPVRRIK